MGFGCQFCHFAASGFAAVGRRRVGRLADEHEKAVRTWVERVIMGSPARFDVKFSLAPGVRQSWFDGLELLVREFAPLFLEGNRKGGPPRQNKIR